MNAFFSALMALIQPSLTSLEGKLASVGATFGAGPEKRHQVFSQTGAADTPFDAGIV